MKIIVLLFIILSSITTTSKAALTSKLFVLGKSDVAKIPIKSHETIGLEKKDMLLVKDSGTQLLIQGLREGDSILRVGEKTYKIIVTNQTNLKIYQMLSSTLTFCSGIYLDYQDKQFLIKGRLDQPSTWMTLSRLYLNNFKMEAEINASHLIIIEHEINKTLTKAGFFPIRLFLEPYPTVRLPSSAAQNHQVSEILSHFGINIKEDNKRIYFEPLVRVQVHIAEVRKSFAQNIGIEWPYQFSAKLIPEGLIPIDGGANAFVNLFAHKGNGRILASPVLLAKSGSDAEFFAGGEFPVKSKTKQTQTVNWKKYGITLKIKPLADPDGKISLDLNTEVSSLDLGEKMDGIPSLFTNTLSSHFDLHSSQTIALSGLVKKVDGESLKLWPGIGEIPILGTLFTSREYQEDKTELLVLVTPVIVGQD